MNQSTRDAFHHYYRIAQSLNRSCPSGIAICMLNRQRHGVIDRYDYYTRPSTGFKPKGHIKSLVNELRAKEIKMIQKISDETANRWLTHHLNGGSLESLSRQRKR